MTSNYRFAVLLAIHNRVDKTLKCLKNLYKEIESLNLNADVYIVDDYSTDGSSEIISERFEEVNIIKGSGNLFWNKGMKLAWEYSISQKEYDFFLWLNNDTYIIKNGLDKLLLDYQNIVNKNNSPAIITGACSASNSKKFSYGGRDKNGPIIPNGTPQKCRFINGNIVLIPMEIQLSIGILSEKYTHSLGDYDYGLRAINAGFLCYTTSDYIAICDNNPIQDWMNPKKVLKQRIRNFIDVRGLNVLEFTRFNYIHEGPIIAIWRLIKVLLQLVFPYHYQSIKKRNN